MKEKRGKLDRDRFNNKKNNKKAQVTLFIILAIVLLLAASLYFFYNLGVKPEEYIADEIMPVKNFVEACLDDIVRDGLAIIGQNGGYIGFPNEINNNPKSFLPTPLSVNYKNPYWWYQGKTAIPPEDFLKKELVDHINNNFDACINDFKVFSRQFEIKEKKRFTATVDFSDNDVKVNMEYPLIIKNLQNNSRSDISYFFVEIPVRLKKAHELASKITEINIKTKFLEYKAIDLISMDQDIPTTDFEISCNEKRWPLFSIENKIKQLLEKNLPYIRVKGTSYNKDIYVPNPFGAERYTNSYYQNHYIMDIGDLEYDNMHVAFIYDTKWPIHLVARPSDGRILKSRPLRGQNILSFFCMHTWHFTYDFEFPVKISIVDERTEDHDTYALTFAVLASIDHMQPDRQNLGHVVFETADKISDDEFCNDLFNNVEILTADKITNEPVKDVNLTLICGSYYCPLGQTEIFSLGAAAGIRKRMPLCSAGYIEVQKNGYSSKKYPIQTDYDSSHTILLEPIKEIENIKVVKHSPIDYSQELELGDSESATISLSIPNEDFEAYVPYPLIFAYPFILKAKKDYTYNVEIYLVKGDDFSGAYSGKWTVPWQALKDANAIKFHVVESGLGDEAKSEFIEKLPEVSKKVPLPELIIK